MGESKKRWTEIDNLYAIGTLLVVLGHSHSSDWSSFDGTIMVQIINFIYAFHMPLFFFIAGFLFQHSNSIEKIGYPSWILDKIKRLGTPYFVLSLIALIPKYYVENGGFQGFNMKYLMTVILQPRIGVWGHFWFLPVLLLMYVFMGLIRGLYGKNMKPRQYVLVLCIAFVMYFEPFTTNWIGFDDIKNSLIYFSLGMVWYRCAFKKHNRKANYMRNLLSILLVLATWIFAKLMYGNKPVMLVYALMMIFACWEIAGVIGKQSFTRWISNHNFTIYIYSWPFQAVTMVIASKLGMPWFATTGIMFVAGLVGPIVMITIYDNIKLMNNRFFDLLLGVK